MGSLAVRLVIAASHVLRFFPGVVIGVAVVVLGIRACQALANLGDQIVVVNFSASSSQSNVGR